MKMLTVVIVLVGIMGLLVYTNPSLKYYEEFVRGQVIKETSNQKAPSRAPSALCLVASRPE